MPGLSRNGDQEFALSMTGAKPLEGRPDLNLLEKGQVLLGQQILLLLGCGLSCGSLTLQGLDAIIILRDLWSCDAHDLVAVLQTVSQKGLWRAARMCVLTKPRTKSVQASKGFLYACHSVAAFEVKLSCHVMCVYCCSNQAQLQIPMTPYAQCHGRTDPF